MGQVAIDNGGLAGATHDSSVTETTEERIAAVRDLEHQFGIGAVENPVVGGGASVAASTQGMFATAGMAATTGMPAAAGMLPAAGRAPATAAMRKTAGRGSTGSAWMIALSPLLALVLGIAAAYVYLYLFANPIVFVVAAGIPYLLCVVWALTDGRTLRSRGFEAPSPALALLTGLGYLIARRTRVPGSGPIAMLLVVAVLAFGSPLAAIGLGQTQGLANALNVQRTISADYIGHGKAVFVNCPPFVDAVTVGSLYTCDATTATGVHRTVWVSIDGDNGKFSYSFGL
jgi:Meckel syndrome type 1 protein